MIAERTTVQIQSTMVGQSYQAGIDDENMSHIISLFTDLYSDREMAVIREYSTNARDAQIEAGVDAPIEVTLPNSLAPFFQVKDRGVGLSHDDIRTIYSRYGTSTKRATNDQNGMLGLGCKAALTYADQFTVESNQNGVKTICAISRDGHSVPVFTVLDTRATDEPNGTTVTVPVRRDNRFEEKANKLFRHWRPGTVLVNGAQPTPLEGLRLSDTHMIVKYDRYTSETDLVVMGGVAYPHTFDHGLPYGHRLIVEVPIGSVEFAPSREALSYSSRTNATLAKVIEGLSEAATKAVQAEIDQATTTRGAILKAVEWRELLGDNVNLNAFTFKGRQMRTTLDGDWKVVRRSSHKMSDCSSFERGVPLDMVANSIFVIGYDVQNFTAVHKRKLLQYAQNAGIQPSFFILGENAPDMEWVEQDQIHSWDAVRTIKLAPTASRSYDGRPTGSYDALIGGGHKHIQAEDIDTDEAIFYCQGYNRYEGRTHAETVQNFYPTSTVVFLPENRAAKFKRHFPDAQPFKQGIQTAYDGWIDTLTDEVRTALEIDDRGKRYLLSRMDASKVDDPEVVAAIHLAEVPLAAVHNARKRFNKAMWMLKAKSIDVDWENPLDKYPLVAHLNSPSITQEDDFYLYLNAAYAARKSAGNNA